jgi:pimeloyl-ACP methyl ester carboxylesterase
MYAVDLLGPYLMALLPEKTIEEKSTVVAIANTQKANRRGDVVFVHGLDGDGMDTWTSNVDGRFYWPEELGKDLEDVGVWVVNYEAQITEWVGHTMPIQAQSQALLNALKNNGIGERRVVFIGHSLGGILIKQILEDSRDLGINEWTDISTRTKGVIFLGTPNTGADLATLLGFMQRLGIAVRASVTQEQLRRNAPVLMRLNSWYRNNVERLEILTEAFYETQKYRGQLVVDQTSADPGIPNRPAIAVTANHVTICKPRSRRADVYQSVKRFIDNELFKLPDSYPGGMAQCVNDFKVAKGANELDQFKADHVGQLVAGECVVRDVNKDKKNPNYSVALSAEEGTLDWIIATFRNWNFDQDVKVGQRIRISGLLHRKTSKLGLILEECTFDKN